MKIFRICTFAIYYSVGVFTAEKHGLITVGSIWSAVGTVNKPTEVDMHYLNIMKDLDIDK